MLYLRQATSVTVNLGPWVGSDGLALTGLTITQSTLMLGKNGSTFVAKNETTNASHRILGYYSAMFDNTDTGSLGRLLVVSSAANALPVRHEFTILPNSVYDALIEGSSLLQTNLVLWRGTAPNALTANRVDASVGAMADAVVTSAALASGGVDKMANLLAVDMSSLTATVAARSPINALRVLRNRVTTSGGLTVYAENDSTAVWTGDLTTNSSADPIIESNPA